MIADFKLTRNFWLKEFFSWKEWVKFQKLPPQRQAYICARLALIASDLQEVRDHFKKPVTVNDGLRFDDDKFHGAFVAADINVYNVPHREVQQFFENRGYKGGVGSYNAHTHIDARHMISERWTKKPPARWEGVSI